MNLLHAFRERRPFPGQDPWVVAHDGSFLLVQTAGGNRRIVVKRFKDFDRMDRVAAPLRMVGGPDETAPVDMNTPNAPRPSATPATTTSTRARRSTRWSGMPLPSRTALSSRLPR